MGLFAKIRTQIRNERLKKNKGNNTKVKSAQNKKRSSSSVGNIYYVHPSHVVPAKDLKEYGKRKNNYNKRPVAIVKEKKNGDVDVTKIYGTPGKSRLVHRKKRTPLSTTKTTKRSWISTEDKSYSDKTGNQFRKNIPPLTKKKGKVTAHDLVKRSKTKKATAK